MGNELISAVFLEQVCPICAATLGKDPLGHFMVQHAQSVKVTLVHCEVHKVFLLLVSSCKQTPLFLPPFFLCRGGEST